MSYAQAQSSGEVTTSSAVVRPPFDPALQDPNAVFALPEILDVELIRKAAALFNADTVLEKCPELIHTECSVPPLDETENHVVPLSVFHSKTSTNTQRPAFFYIHGGGQVSGNRFFGLERTISYFDGIDVVFVAVGYRLAPEHRAPAALHDCYAALAWTADNAAKLGIDPSKILIFGVSGGGPLAAASAIMARDRQHPKLCAQMLLTPMLDDRDITVSSKQFEHGTLWCGVTNRMAWDHVLGENRGGPKVTELMAPARATDLAGLPPTFIDAGECEVFRDEAVAYASQLWKCGVSAELHVWPGAYHGFDMLSPDAPVARTARATKIAWIRKILGVKEGSSA